MSLIANVPILWPFYCLLGRAFPRDIVLFRLDEGGVFASDTLFDLEVALRTREITKAVDPFQFFLFFALSSGVPWLRNAVYIKEAGCMWQNLHLFPGALVTFIDLFKVLSIACDAQIVGDVMSFFFSMVHRIIDRVWAVQEVGMKVWSTFVVLVDTVVHIIESLHMNVHPHKI
jgi:hypothetical protein